MTQDNKHLNGYISEPDDDIGYTADAAADDDLDPREMRAALSPENYYPTCRYCGQVKLPLAPYASQDAANEAATRECDCTEARVYRAEIERKEKRDENIKRLTQQLDSLSEYCENRSVDLNGELYDYLLKAGIAVLDGIIESAQLKFARMRVSVGTNSKANLGIKFTYSDGATVEV